MFRKLIVSSLLLLSACQTTGTTKPSVVTFQSEEQFLSNFSEPSKIAYDEVYGNFHKNKVLALSPSGKLGATGLFLSEEWAKFVAMRNCREKLETGETDCVLFDINGRKQLTYPIVLEVWGGENVEPPETLVLKDIEESKGFEAERGYRWFVADENTPKALAVSPGGAWAWRAGKTLEDAKREALDSCNYYGIRKHGYKSCFIYAVGNDPEWFFHVKKVLPAAVTVEKVR